MRKHFIIMKAVALATAFINKHYSLLFNFSLRAANSSSTLGLISYLFTKSSISSLGGAFNSAIALASSNSLLAFSSILSKFDMDLLALFTDEPILLILS